MNYSGLFLQKVQLTSVLAKCELKACYAGFLNLKWQFDITVSF